MLDQRAFVGDIGFDEAADTAGDGALTDPQTENTLPFARNNSAKSTRETILELEAQFPSKPLRNRLAPARLPTKDAGSRGEPPQVELEFDGTRGSLKKHNNPSRIPAAEIRVPPGLGMIDLTQEDSADERISQAKVNQSKKIVHIDEEHVSAAIVGRMIYQTTSRSAKQSRPLIPPGLM